MHFVAYLVLPPHITVMSWILVLVYCSGQSDSPVLIELSSGRSICWLNPTACALVRLIQFLCHIGILPCMIYSALPALLWNAVIKTQRLSGEQFLSKTPVSYN